MPAGSVVVVMDGGGSTLIWSEADCPGKETDVAVTVTIVSEATAAGALYVAAVVVTPVRVPAPEGGFKLQFTPAPDESLLTAAVMETVPPWRMVCVVFGVSTTR